MVQTFEAVFDGSVFRPDGHVELLPNTRVRLLVETTALAQSAPESFLQTAKSLKVDGPADWSSKIDDYL